MKALLLLAFTLWAVMFFPPLKGLVPFWPAMTLASGLLAAAALTADRAIRRELTRFQWIDLPIGILSAGVLYGIFFIGHALSTTLLPFAAGQVQNIYAIRPEANPWKIALLLMLWIGPAEEIFWRGLVQRRLCQKLPLLAGLLIAAALYTAVHIPSLNPMLIAASAVCGLFWGLLYLAVGRLWPVILSHALWDVLAFILFPIT